MKKVIILGLLVMCSFINGCVGDDVKDLKALAKEDQTAFAKMYFAEGARQAFVLSGIEQADELSEELADGYFNIE